MVIRVHTIYHAQIWPEKS